MRVLKEVLYVWEKERESGLLVVCYKGPTIIITMGKFKLNIKISFNVLLYRLHTNNRVNTARPPAPERVFQTQFICFMTPAPERGSRRSLYVLPETRNTKHEK